MAHDRRIIYGVYVVPQESYSTTDTSETLEEGSTVHGAGGAYGRAQYTDYRVEATVTNTTTGKPVKYLGGKSKGTDHVQIAHDQTTDYWTSMASVGQMWNLFDETWNGTASTWDTGAGEVAVNDSLSVIRSGSTGIKFLYIKNLGTVECELALEGDERDILIPAGASVSMRTDSSVVTAATVKVATAASSSATTTIEYVIAI